MAPAKRPWYHLRLRFLLVLAGIAAGVFVLYRVFSLPVGDGPAGPAVPAAPFEQVWSLVDVLLLGLGDSVPEVTASCHSDRSTAAVAALKRPRRRSGVPGLARSAFGRRVVNARCLIHRRRIEPQLHGYALQGCIWLGKRGLDDSVAVCPCPHSVGAESGIALALGSRQGEK